MVDYARIDPGSAFRLVVKVAKYVANGEYGLVEMAEQQHDLWFGRNSEYNLALFHEDLATRIIWGPSQTLSVWVLDQDTGSEWKIRRDEHLQQMVKDRWDERMAFIAVDVVSKGGFTDKGSSIARCVSSVTDGSHVGPSHVPDNAEGCGDTCRSPPAPPLPTEQPIAVDWNTLTIQENPDDDGLATQLVDEEQVYEAMGFKEVEAQEADRKEVPIPVITVEM